MLEMLREHQIGPRFRALMIGAQKAKGAPIALIAVPFWGKDAIKILGLGRRENVRIICNLNSTACNPHVIENLKKGKVVQLVRKLFEELWNSGETTPVDASALSRAKIAYKNRPRNNRLANGKQKFASLKKGMVGPTKNLTAADFRKAWAYQFSNVLPKDSWIIDLDCINSEYFRVRGCAQVTGLQLKVRGEEDLMLALRGVAAFLSTDDGSTSPRRKNKSWSRTPRAFH